MPLVPSQSPNLADPYVGVDDLHTADQQAQQEQDSPTNSQIWGAAFRQFNSIGSSLANKEFGMQTDQGQGPYIDPAFNIGAALKGTKYEDRIADFGDVFNRQDLAARQSQIDMEDADKATMARSGWMGTLAGLTAGIADPTMLLPVAGEINEARSAYNVGSAALKTGLSVGGAAAVQQGLLAGTQRTLTGQDAAIAIGSSALLGGLLGGAVHFLAPAARDAASAALDRMRAPDAPSVQVPSLGDAGAAAVDRFSREDLSIDGGAAGAIADKTAWLNPNLRLNTSPSAEARLTGQQLAENTLFQALHNQGDSVGPAAETLMRTTMLSRLADAMADHNTAFLAGRKAGMNMTRPDFEDAVGQAMRRNDIGPNDWVTQSAQAWRKKLFDPFKQEAIDHGLLPADVDVSTADSYFRRLWNVNRLNAEEGRFKQIATDHYSGLLQKEYGDDIARLNGRTTKLQQEAQDLKLDPAMRDQEIQDVEAKQQALYGNAPDHVDMADQLSELRQQLVDANRRGDKQAAATAREAAANLKKQGGDPLQQFLAQRAELNTRRRNLDLGYASMSDRSDTIRQSLADLEDANRRSMLRLIRKGQNFQKDLQRLDPEKLAGRVTALREGFAAEAEKAERQADRFRAQLDKIEKAKTEGKSVGATGADLLDRQAKAEQARADRMNAIATRLEAAENLDPQAMIDEVQHGVDRMVDEVSGVSLSRGERAQRLQDRLANLDPEKVNARLKAIEEMQHDMERRHFDKWEIGRGGEGVEARAGGKQDFTDYSRDIVNAVYDKLTGRGMDNNIPEGLVPATRGPLKERTFDIPDHLVEDFLHDNIIHVAHDYGRKMASEIELTRRFGSADLKEPLARIQNEYRGLRDQITNAASVDEMRQIAGKNPGMLQGVIEKAKAPTVEGVRADMLRYLTKAEKSDTTDVQAMRDLLRGTYKAANMNNVWGRTARGLMAYNYLTRMGSVVISNFGEVYRAANVYGLKSFMGEGVAPLLSRAGREAAGMSVKEAKLAGQVIERVLQHRIASWSEMGDPYARGTAIERLLDNGGRVASRWSGLSLWTDSMKSVSSILAQNRILGAIAGGGEDRLIAYLGFNPAMRARAVEQVKQFATKVDGVWMANTERWTDPEAVRVYRAALSKDVDSVIVTKGVGDAPLFSNTPTGKIITQFKAFNLASHQRVLLRGLQESPTRFMSGLVAMTGLGMASIWFRAFATNRLDKLPGADDPGWWIGEGLDSSGIFAVPFELANDLEKPLGINMLKDPMRAAGRAVTGAQSSPESFRNTNRNSPGALLGPTFGMGSDLFNLLGTLSSAARGQKMTPGQAKSAITSGANLTPFYSYPILRQIIDYGVKPALNNAVGAKP